MIENERAGAFIKCDVSDPDSINSLVEKTINRYGQIDVLIHNAGISTCTPPDELRAGDWDRIINANLRSCFLLTRSAAKEMKKTGGGTVVNSASTRAVMSEKNSKAYV